MKLFLALLLVVAASADKSLGDANKLDTPPHFKALRGEMELAVLLPKCGEGLGRAGRVGFAAPMLPAAGTCDGTPPGCNDDNCCKKFYTRCHDKSLKMCTWSGQRCVMAPTKACVLAPTQASPNQLNGNRRLS